ncbi:MAG: acyl-CoA dehydrogenase, partial [Marinomonas sp.]
MDFEPTERQAYWSGRIRDFIEEHVRPNMDVYKAQDAEGDRWKVIPIVQEKKKIAKEAGLWNLFMPPRNDGHHHVEETFEFEGPGLTNLEYALCAEEMGRISWASEVFNCSAPDTG